MNVGIWRELNLGSGYHKNSSRIFAVEPLQSKDRIMFPTLLFLQDSVVITLLQLKTRHWKDFSSDSSAI